MMYLYFTYLLCPSKISQVVNLWLSTSYDVIVVPCTYKREQEVHYHTQHKTPFSIQCSEECVPFWEKILNYSQACSWNLREKIKFRSFKLIIASNKVVSKPELDKIRVGCSSLGTYNNKNTSTTRFSILFNHYCCDKMGRKMSVLEIEWNIYELPLFPTR